MEALDDLRGPECVVCGASIEGKRSDARYCSAKCYNLEAGQMESEALLAAKANRPPCRICGGAIPISAPINRIYCSLACNKEATNRRIRERLAKPCLICGKAISTTHPDQKYCSRRCLYKAQKVVKRRTCRSCGKHFQQRKAKQKYCCHECAAAARRKPDAKRRNRSSTSRAR
jgi:predicted nucleic acid-binding Zn ribbon protein